MERYLLPIKQIIVKKNGQVSKDIAGYVMKDQVRYPISGTYIIVPMPVIQSGSMELSIARTALSAISFGEYAVFGGGNEANTGSSVIYHTGNTDVFSDLLVRVTIENGFAGGSYTAVVNGDYAIFAGGQWSVHSTSNAEALDINLTWRSITPLHKAMFAPKGAAVGNYTLIGDGGEGFMTSYDTALTRGAPPDIIGMSLINAVTLGGFAIFNGYVFDAEEGEKAAFAYYDSALTLRVADVGGQILSGAVATTQNHAIFAGIGENGDEVWLLNTALTKTKIASVSQVRSGMSVATVGGYTLIGGGQGPSPRVGYTEMFDTVDIFDRFFSRRGVAYFSQKRTGTVSASSPNYAFFGGGTSLIYREGSYSHSIRSNVVDYYTFD